MTEYMKEADKGGCVLRILIQMAQDDNELKKEIAISLFGDLAIEVILNGDGRKLRYLF